jgi:hypothetical protein
LGSCGWKSTIPSKRDQYQPPSHLYSNTYAVNGLRLTKKKKNNVAARPLSGGFRSKRTNGGDSVMRLKSRVCCMSCTQSFVCTFQTRNRGDSCFRFDLCTADLCGQLITLLFFSSCGQRHSSPLFFLIRHNIVTTVLVHSF